MKTEERNKLLHGPYITPRVGLKKRQQGESSDEQTQNYRWRKQPNAAGSIPFADRQGLGPSRGPSRRPVQISQEGRSCPQEWSLGRSEEEIEGRADHFGSSVNSRPVKISILSRSSISRPPSALWEWLRRAGGQILIGSKFATRRVLTRPDRRRGHILR